MTNRRDRHGRGIRGPLVRNSGALGFSVDRRFVMTHADRFATAVDAAVERITRRNPHIFHGISVGIEDVPPVSASTTQVTLATATEPSPEWPARVVLYRRPLEHRSDTNRSLESLVFRTLVEQLAALTGIDARRIAPDLDNDA